MDQRFVDNLSGTEGDPFCLERLTSRNFQPNKEKK
jgi:hypothetical protein